MRDDKDQQGKQGSGRGHVVAFAVLGLFGAVGASLADIPSMKVGFLIYTAAMILSLALLKVRRN
jgi:hypothetical protein